MPRENRLDQRFNYEHLALLVEANPAPTGCRIGNVCHGGLWVSELDDRHTSRRWIAALERSEYPGVEVHITCRHAGEDAGFVLPAKILRASRRGFGLQFEQPQPDFVTRLNQIYQETGKTRLNGIDERELEPVLGELVQRLEARLSSLLLLYMDALFNDLPAHHPDHCPLDRFRCMRTFWSREIQSIWERQIHAMCEKRKPGASDRRRSLSEPSLPPHRMGERPAARTEGVGRDLGPVDVSAIDEADLCVRQSMQEVCTHLQRLWRLPLMRIQQRLSQLLRAQIDEQRNPISPLSLCRGLAVFGRVESGLEPSAIAYCHRMFREVASDEIGVIYEECDKFLADLGLQAVRSEFASRQLATAAPGGQVCWLERRKTTR